MLGCLPPELTQLPHAAVGFSCFSEVCLVRGSFRWKAPPLSCGDASPPKLLETDLLQSAGARLVYLDSFLKSWRQLAHHQRDFQCGHVVKCTISHPAARRARTR